MGDTEGILVSVDGPPGVGKSVTAEALAERLRETGLTVYVAAEPTTRRVSPSAGGLHARLCRAAANRYDFLEKVVRPRRAAGDVVIIDGYVVADFVSNLTSTADLTFVKAVNQAADRPEIAIVLTAEPNTLAERRLQRGRRRRGSWALQTELKHYQTASEALARTGVTVLRLEASLYPPEVLAAMIEVRLVAARTLRRRRT